MKAEKRGVMYMAWGENAIAQAKQSIGSLRRWAPELPVIVVGDQATEVAFADTDEAAVVVCDVDPFEPNQKKGYTFLAGRVKPLLGGISPWERTLYVDADTYFQASPMEGFDLLERWDVALAETETRSLAQGIAGRAECHATADELGTGLLLYHNSGMIFWRKNARTKALFELWREEWERFGGWDEQVALLRALLRSEAIYLTLPYTWNHSGLKDCYMLSHWFGAGDARIDMVRRERALASDNGRRARRSPMIRIDIAPGQWVQCRSEDEGRVRRQYQEKIDEKEAIQQQLERKFVMRDPMVKVFQGRNGEYVKMRKGDAVRLGLRWEYETPKRAGQVENKFRAPEEDKMMTPEGSKAEMVEPVSQVDELEDDRSDEFETVERDDFTEIPGIGKATAAALNERGICTFDDLMEADVTFLPGKAQAAVEAWRR